MTKIKDLKEKDHLTQCLMIKSCTKGITQKGSPYLNLVVQDNTGTIDGKLWDCKAEDEANAVAGKVAMVAFEVLEYNHALQLRVNRVTAVDQSEIKLSDYLLASEIDEETARARISTLVASLRSATLRTLVNGMLQRLQDAFFEYPAASKIHHGYLGGLAEHTLGMCDLAEQVASLYPMLDRDLLIAGAIVHDMGKTKELGGVVSGEYTTEGRLIGHISIAHGWLMEVAEENGLENEEETTLLRHMILSHHGKMEFGSPVLPEIPEAEVLSMIDNLDARMNTLNAAMAQVKPGTWTPKMFSMESRQFYRAKNKKEEM